MIRRLSEMILEFLADGKYRGAGHMATHYNWDVPFDEVVRVLNDLVDEGRIERHPRKQLFRKVTTE